MSIVNFLSIIVSWILLVVTGMKSVMVFSDVSLFDIYMIINAFLLATLVVSRVLNWDLDDRAIKFRKDRNS